MSLDDVDFGSKRRSKKYSYKDEDSYQEGRKVRVFDTTEASVGETLAVDGDVVEDVEDKAACGKAGLTSASEELTKRDAHSFPSESENVDPFWQWRNEKELDNSCDVTNDVECDAEEDLGICESVRKGSEKKKFDKELKRKQFERDLERKEEQRMESDRKEAERKEARLECERIKLEKAVKKLNPASPICTHLVHRIS